MHAEQTEYYGLGQTFSLGPLIVYRSVDLISYFVAPIRP
jgi:hypothetical protein